MNDVRHEIAHLARVELLTPNPDGTLWFFTKLLGMYETYREGQSVYLRGYEDPYEWSLKVTESPEAGLRQMALRASSADALERRVKSLQSAHVEGRWNEDEFGYGKTYEYLTPDGHEFALLWEAQKYVAPPELRSPIKTRASKKPLQGIPVKRLDHVNLLARDVSSSRESLERHLGYTTRERLVDGAEEVGAWLSSNALGHEIAIMRDAHGARGRLHHLAFYYGTFQHNVDAAEMFREYGIRIEAGPDIHGITQGAFLYVFEPGGNRIELFGNSGFLYFEPDIETKTWTLSEFTTDGLAIGGTQMPPEFFTEGTPFLSPEAIADLQHIQI
ncbi:MAG TPA: VOC family protein [Mycobacterium sp.]|nr:VOC family protein [Mycobacterium sp.]